MDPRFPALNSQRQIDGRARARARAQAQARTLPPPLLQWRLPSLPLGEWLVAAAALALFLMA